MTHLPAKLGNGGLHARPVGRRPCGAELAARQAFEFVLIPLRDDFAPFADSGLPDTERIGHGLGSPEVLYYNCFLHDVAHGIAGDTLQSTHGNRNGVYSFRMDTPKAGRGARIKHLRESRKLTQPELAKAIGVTKAAVSKWEKAREPNIDLSTFFALADRLAIDPRELATGEALQKPSLTHAQENLVRTLFNLPKDIQANLSLLIYSIAASLNGNLAKWSDATQAAADKRDAEVARKGLKIPNGT